jgi:hypothetical protein
MSGIPFEVLELGQAYYIEKKIEYETNNNTGYKYAINDPIRLLVKVVGKKEEPSKVVKHFKYPKVEIELIRDLDFIHSPIPVKFPASKEEVYYEDYIWLEPETLLLSNVGRKKTLNNYKQQMVELRGVKKLLIPNSIKAEIASRITGLEGKSIKNQEKALQWHIKELEENFRSHLPREPELKGGRSTKRKRHLKRGFKSLKRKTT